MFTSFGLFLSQIVNPNFALMFKPSPTFIEYGPKSALLPWIAKSVLTRACGLPVLEVLEDGID
jgi:hypothetical protein